MTGLDALLANDLTSYHYLPTWSGFKAWTFFLFISDGVAKRPPYYVAVVFQDFDILYVCLHP